MNRARGRGSREERLDLLVVCDGNFDGRGKPRNPPRVRAGLFLNRDGDSVEWDLVSLGQRLDGRCHAGSESGCHEVGRGKRLTRGRGDFRGNNGSGRFMSDAGAACADGGADNACHSRRVIARASVTIVRTLITLRTEHGSEPLVIDGEYFVDPEGPIDREIATGTWWATGGLADCHAHVTGGDSADQGAVSDDDLSELADVNVATQLDGGVFLVLDKGSRSNASLRVLDEPLALRPDMEMAGRMVASPGGYYPDFAIETDPDGLADVIRSVARPPATWVKLVGDWPRRGIGAVPNFSEEALTQAVGIAHQAGCRVAIHTAAPETASMAVRAGVDSVEHGLFLDETDLRLLGSRGGAWVPTIAAMEALRDMLGADSSGGRLFAQGLNNVRDILASAEGHGVTVLGGSDLSLAHGEVAREGSRLVEYGLSDVRAVAALTTNAYGYAGIDRSFAKGKPADVVFFERDPAEDVAILERPIMVIRRGVVRS